MLSLPIDSEVWHHLLVRCNVRVPKLAYLDAYLVLILRFSHGSSIGAVPSFWISFAMVTSTVLYDGAWSIMICPWSQLTGVSIPPLASPTGSSSVSSIFHPHVLHNQLTQRPQPMDLVVIFLHRSFKFSYQASPFDSACLQRVRVRYWIFRYYLRRYDIEPVEKIADAVGLFFFRCIGS